MARKKIKRVAKSKTKKVLKKTKLDTVQAFNSNIDEIFKKEIAPTHKEESMAPEVIHERIIDERKNIRAPQRTAR